jgi:hypothetical protein
MEVSYAEGLASHNRPESCVSVREDEGEALTGGSSRQGCESGWVREIYPLARKRRIPRDADAVEMSGRLHLVTALSPSGLQERSSKKAMVGLRGLPSPASGPGLKLSHAGFATAS